MKKFIVHILCFIAPLIILAYPLDVILSKNLAQNKTLAAGEYNVWNDIFQRKLSKEDIVIYGSSRAWVNFNTPMISDSLHLSAYNLGMDGQVFDLQHFRGEQFAKYNSDPKTIILSLDIFTLQKKDELYNTDQFLPYMLWDKDIKAATSKYKGFDIADYNIPLIRYIGNYNGILRSMVHIIVKNKPIPGKYRVMGYMGQEKEWNNDFDNAKKKMKSEDVVLNKGMIQQFDSFLRETKFKGINIVFVYSPEYIEGQQFEKNRKQIMDLYTSFSKKYSIPFFDFSNDSICFNKQYFYNASHMNKKGSDLFTSQLIDSLKQMPFYSDDKGNYR